MTSRPTRFLTDEQADQILYHYGIKPMPLVRAAIKRAYTLGQDNDVMRLGRQQPPTTDRKDKP